MAEKENTPQGPPADPPRLTHSQTVNRQREITAELARLAELDEPLPADEKAFEDLQGEFYNLDGYRKRLERLAQLEKVRGAEQNIQTGSRLLRTEHGTRQGSTATGTDSDYDADPFLNPDSIEDHRFRNPWDLTQVRTYGRDKAELRQELGARALDAISKMRGANDKIRQAATQILERHEDDESTISRLVLASSSSQYLRAWSKVMSNRMHLLTVEEQKAMEQVRAMSLTPSGGGYLVPFQLDPTVIITANGSNTEIRQVARQVVATGNKWNGVSAGLVSWSWDAEATEVSDDAPTFAQPSIDIFMARGFVPISIEAMEDEANVTANVGELLAGGREVLESSAFINGTGTGQPWGIVAALTGTSSEIATATGDTLAVGDIYGAWGALPTRYRRNATWLGNTLIYNRVRQFDTAGGSALWATLGNGTPDGLLGRRVLESEDMTGTITAAQNNRVLVVGDFSNFVIADRLGMTTEFIPHLFGTANGRPKGQRGWFAYYRTGSDSVNDAAFRLLNA